MYESTGWDEKNPPFALGQPLYVKPDVFGDEAVDYNCYIVVGFFKKMFTGWFACVVPDYNLAMKPYTIACALLSARYPGEKETPFSRRSQFHVIKGGKHG